VGPRKGNRDTHFLFLSKVPVNEPPPGSPTRPLWRELPICKAFFYISVKSLKKISIIKKFFPFLKGPKKGLSLYVPQKRGTYGNRRPFSEPYLAYPSGSPVKEPPLHVPLMELPWREMPNS